MTVSKQTLFYDNKARIEQAWKLLEVAGELVSDVVDESGTNLANAHDVYETIVSANDALYQTYEANKEEHHENCKRT
jgi:hypothetical protein